MASLFGVARDFRATHGEEAFAALAAAAFQEADATHDGTIDASELKEVLQNVGIRLNDEQIRQVLVRYDADQSGVIEESEFLPLVSDLVDGSLNATQIKAKPVASSKGEPQTTEVQLRDQVSELQATNKALEARVATLETQMRHVLALNGQSHGAEGGAQAPPAVSTEAAAQSAASAGRAGAAPSAAPAGRAQKETRRSCPYCGHAWLDKYSKDECPKCLNPLSTLGMVPRVPGEAVTNKQCASSAMESESGSCPKGGMHTFRFGKCSKCGKGEGKELADRNTGGECPEGGRHVFKFTRCTKCGGTEGRC